MYDYLQDLFAGGALTFEEFSGKLEKADGIKLVNLKDGGYVGRDKFDALAAERDGLKGQLAQASEKLEGYDPEWKQKAADAEQKSAAQVSALKADYAAENAAAGLKFSSVSAKNAFLADLKAKGLTLQDDGKLLGFDDFVKEYKGADPDAFAPDKPAPTVTVPGQGRAPAKTGQAYVDDKYKHNPFYHPKGE